MRTTKSSSQYESTSTPTVSGSGILLVGTVIQRSKRSIPEDNPTTEIVTYTITDDNDRHFFVDDYAPESYYDMNARVCIPIYIKPYKKKTGEASYSLNVLKPFRPTVTKGTIF